MSSADLTTDLLSVQPKAGLLGFKITQSLLLKGAAGTVLSIIGMYYLAMGKKNQSLNSMLLGGALILFSLFLF